MGTTPRILGRVLCLGLLQACLALSSCADETVRDDDAEGSAGQAQRRGGKADDLVDAGTDAGVTPRGTIAARIVRSRTDLPTDVPALGTYRLHLIDVGTGLAVLIEGNDFTMLFDGGSGDDKRGFNSVGNRSRLLAYLRAAIGPSGPSRCISEGDVWPTDSNGGELTLDHVLLSHPHDDHGSMLDEVLACYQVSNIWDSGAINPAVFYQDFIKAVATETGATYHTVAQPTPNRAIQVLKGSAPVVLDDTVGWSTFVDSDRVVLGQGAWFDVLYADAAEHGDFNHNSLVVRVQLGDVSVLLMGDAESGERALPSAPAGDTEAFLLTHHREEIDTDVLLVGHHGSETSSRRVFLDAVSPTWALISAGPKSYSGVVLPDASVVAALQEVVGNPERLLVTNVYDANNCPVADRIGMDDDRPGGCDNFLLTVSGSP